MRVMKTNRNLTARTALLATALLLAATAALGESAGEGLPGDWLSRYASPRSVGRGGAGAAVPGEAQGALWNPASAAWLTQNQVQASSTQLFEGTSVNGLAFAAPSASMPSVAFNLLALKSGDELAQITGQQISRQTPDRHGKFRRRRGADLHHRLVIPGQTP